MNLQQLILQVNDEEQRASLQKEYNRLIMQSVKLVALESGGVDNWQGYDDSLQYMREDFRFIEDFDE